MANNKRLNSVCHSIAHHAVSGLSYVHPHLRKMCNLASVYSASLDLLSENPYPQGLEHYQPLYLAMGALREKLSEILISEGFSLNNLDSAIMRFEFEPSFKDEYRSNCFVELVSKTGKSYHVFVDYFGNKISKETSIVI